MDEEFKSAYQELLQDNQPVYLTLTKLSAWLMLTPIQLAAKHPQAKNSVFIKKAVKVAKAIETLVVSDSPTLKEVARCGWLCKEPKVSTHQFKSAFVNLPSEEISLQLSKEEVWCVLVASQLASRHPEYKNTEAARLNKIIVDQLTEAIPKGDLLTILRAGWDTRFDQPINKKGFG